MPRLPPEIAAFKDKYSLAIDDVWPVPGGKSYAIKHKALERIAAEVGIKFDPPTILEIDLEKKLAGMIVFASLGEHKEWATGEAAPGNCKNAYTLAMAEKRAKDRCILKLLKVHGEIYSSEELTEQRPNPHVNKPEDVSDAVVEVDEYGEYVDNIPNADPGIERTTPYKDKGLRADYEAAQKEMHATVTDRQLEVWGERNANRLGTYPLDWQEIFRKLYAEHRDKLRGVEVAA